MRVSAVQVKPVLINVCAIWCGPRQSEQPKLHKLYEEVKDTLSMSSEKPC